MKTRKVLLAGSLAALLATISAYAQAPDAISDPTAFSQGQSYRQSWETWINSLPDGPYKAGALWWASVRSTKQASLGCTGSGMPDQNAWSSGCQSAKALLDITDTYRHNNPSFRAGWNSVYNSPQPAAQANIPAAITANKKTNIERTTTPQTGETIALTKDPEGDLYRVEVRINRVLTIPFILDSGASDVVLPRDVFKTLQRSGTIRQSDFIGAGTATLADGSKHPSEAYILHDVQVGNQVLHDIEAQVTPETGDPLLGQAFLKKLPTWSIDNTQPALIIGRVQNAPPPSSTLADNPSAQILGPAPSPTTPPATATNGPTDKKIQPTSTMLAQAKQLFSKDCTKTDIGRCIYNFRNTNGYIWACVYHYGYNWGYCDQTPMSQIKKIDEAAEDLCRHSGPDAIIPHAMTGEADELNYKCVGGHMKRDPYSKVFDMDGWSIEQWKPIN